jgi:hypothetical protein
LYSASQVIRLRIIPLGLADGELAGFAFVALDGVAGW